MALIKQPPFRNVGQGLTAVLPLLDIGGTFKALHFELGTLTKANIDEIRVRYQGVLIVQLSGTELDEFNQSRKLAASATVLSLHFANPNSRTITGEMTGAIDTSDATKFSIEMDLNAAAGVGLTLECWVDVVAPKDVNDQHKHTITALLKNTHAPAAAGKFNLPIALGSNAGSLLRSVNFFHANITQIDVRKGSQYLQDQGTNALVQHVQNELRRASIAGLISFDPVYSDNQSDAIATLREPGKPANFTFDVTVSAADVVNAVSELYTTVDRL